MPTPNEFTAFHFGEQQQDYKDGSQRDGGDYGQVNPELTGPHPGNAMIPDSVPSKQFSSDTNGTPTALADETRASMSKFAELQEHLNNSLETPGTRVWHDRAKPWTPPHGEK